MDAARRTFAEHFPGFALPVWRSCCRRLGEAVCLTAALLIPLRAYWAIAQDPIRDPVRFLAGMLRKCCDRETILGQARAVLANRRTPPEPEIQTLDAPPPDPAPEMPAEPERASTPPESAPALPPPARPAERPAPPPRRPRPRDPGPVQGQHQESPREHRMVFQTQLAIQQGKDPDWLAQAPEPIRTEWRRLAGKYGYSVQIFFVELARQEARRRERAG